MISSNDSTNEHGIKCNFGKVLGQINNLCINIQRILGNLEPENLRSIHNYITYNTT